jgi:hypothetical protein
MSTFLAQYLQRVSGNPIGKIPRTLQDVIARRVELDTYAANTEIDTPFTPRIVWRLAWLSVRQVQMVATILPDRDVVTHCNGYVQHLIDFAAWLRRDLPNDTPEPGLLSQYFAESAGFWSELHDMLVRSNMQPLEWMEHQVTTLLWIRFSTFYCCASITQQGRPRSRRELAEILARAVEQSPNLNTLRLRTAPLIEREFAHADRWAALCANQPAIKAP